MKKYHVICEDHDTRFMGELDYGDYDSSEHAIECLESYRDGTDLRHGGRVSCVNTIYIEHL